MPLAVHRHLYLRIWLAVVGALVLMTLVFAGLWRLDAEQARAQGPGREIVVRDAQGMELGRAHMRAATRSEQAVEFEVPLATGEALRIALPRPQHGPGKAWWRPPFDLAWLLVGITLAVALGAYPVVRRLTQRLETLQVGVARWGEGDLSQRLPETGHDEIAFLARRFNTAAAQVEQLVQSHKRLLANASHELRSPLARIRMGLELLGPADPALRDELARNIRELDQLIDEILLASRLDTSPQAMGPREAVDVLALCAEECARLQVTLDIPTPLETAHTQGVATLLRRCVRNLLENAQRHAPGQVRLSLQATPHMLVLRVCDQGPGIPPALRERIFEPFYRLPGASEHDGGVGLGLSLVKTIVQGHGGHVHCEDNPGGGACFVVQLPPLHHRP